MSAPCTALLSPLPSPSLQRPLSDHSAPLRCHTRAQGTSLDHHKLSLQLSKNRPGAAAASGAKSGKGGKGGGEPEDGSTKLVVRNVAFEATRKCVLGGQDPLLGRGASGRVLRAV